MIRSFRGKLPSVPSSCYIDPSAQVIGEVHFGERASVWCNVVIRGDVHFVRIGEESNVQDLSCLHVLNGKFPLQIGARVTIGHHVMLHGCTIEDGALIGMGAVVLDGARIGAGALVAAGALVTPGTVIPPGMVAMGSPARVKRPLNDEERAWLAQSPKNYVEYAREFLSEAAASR
jgi:gamma-carbonic anhydrase